MTNNHTRSIIEIERLRHYCTFQMGVTDLERQVLERLRYLRNRGHCEIIIKFAEQHAVVSPVCEK